MQVVVTRFLAFLFCASFINLAQAVAPNNIDVADFNSDVQSVRDEIDILKKSVAELEKNQYGGDGGSGSSLNRLNATTIAQLEEIREQIRGLRGDIEQLQFDNSRISEKIIKMAADFEHRMSELSKRGPIEDPNSIFSEIDENLDNDLILQQNDTKARNKKGVSKDESGYGANEVSVKKREQEMQTLYDDAYSLLKAKKKKDSLEKFQTFVAEYPDTDLAGNSYYWMGEIFFQERKFDKAAIEYLRGYQANIRGSRAADNLLKLGMSLAKLEKRKEACTTYLKLEKEFPNTTNMIKKKNKAELEKLRCKS